MHKPKSQKFWLLVSLSAMMLVYSIYFLLVREPFIQQHWPLNRKVRHVVQWVGILLVYAFGIVYFKKCPQQWQLQLWNILHWIFIPLLALLGLYDWATTNGLPIGLRLLAQSFGEALISPVFFVSIMLLQRLIAKESAEG